MDYDLTDSIPPISGVYHILNGMTTDHYAEIDCEDLFLWAAEYNTELIQWLIDKRIYFTLKISEKPMTAENLGMAAVIRPTNMFLILTYIRLKLTLHIPNTSHAILFKLTWM
jgi:hypothetical protein